MVYDAIDAKTGSRFTKGLVKGQSGVRTNMWFADKQTESRTDNPANEITLYMNSFLKYIDGHIPVLAYITQSVSRLLIWSVGLSVIK